MAHAAGQQELERTRFAWTLLAATLLWGAMAVPFFTGRVYTRDDLGEYHLPLRAFYSEQLERGEPFDWLPSLFCGYYLTGEGQTGSYHPLHWLLYRCLPLGAAFDLEALISYPLTLAGTFLFLRRRLLRRDAALFGAMVFTFSGFNLLHFVHPNAIAVVAHLPWLLWAIDVACRDANPRRQAYANAAIGLLTGSQLLLGYPQYVWFSLLAELGYVAWLYYSRFQARTRLRRQPEVRLATLLAIASSLAIGVLISAIQLLPTFDALTDSTRQATDVDFANSGSLHPLNLVQLVAPYLFTTRVVGQNTHELGLYAGVVPLALTAWLCSQRLTRRQRRIVIPVAIFTIAALLLACGEHGPIYRIQSWLPVVSRFRFPCRAIVLVHFGLAVLSAIAMALIARNQRSANPTSARLSAPLYACVGLSVLFAIVGPMLWAPYTAATWIVWCGPALMLTAALLATAAARGVRWALIALVVLAAIDQGVYGMSYSIWGQSADLNQFARSMPFPEGNHEQRVVANASDATSHTGNRMLLAGLSRADGYAGLLPQRRFDYRQTAARRIAGVGWVLRSEPREGISGTAESSWQPIDAPLSRVRLVTRTTTDQHVTAESLADSNFAQVVEPLDLAGGPPGVAQLLHDRPGDLCVQTEASNPQLLVTTESFHHGWRATVDGQPVAVIRVNGDFLGCVIPSGRCEVSLKFQPDSLRRGALGSIFGLSLLVGLFVFRFANTSSWR